jgi:hypothetical protein
MTFNVTKWVCLAIAFVLVVAVAERGVDLVGCPRCAWPQPSGMGRLVANLLSGKMGGWMVYRGS